MRPSTRRPGLLGTLLTATLPAALGACAPPIEKPTPVAPPELRPVLIEGVKPLHQVGGLYLAGQPTPEAFAALAERGVEVVIDLRRPGEVTQFDEPAVVRDLGLTYVNLGFGGPDTLTDEVLDQLRELLRRHASQDVLLHCGSSNRVGGAWIAARVLDQGVDYDTALAEARRAGLRNEGYALRAHGYIHAPELERWKGLLTEIRGEFPEVEHVSVAGLRRELTSDGPRPLLFDVRSEAEYEVSHLAGALRAEDLEQAHDALSLRAPGQPVVLYCSVGYRSSRLARELAAAGVDGVRNLEGSLFAWVNAGLPVERDGVEVEEVHPYDADWGRLLRRDRWSDDVR